MPKKAASKGNNAQQWAQKHPYQAALVGGVLLVIVYFMFFAKVRTEEQGRLEANMEATITELTKRQTKYRNALRINAFKDKPTQEATWSGLSKWQRKVTIQKTVEVLAEKDLKKAFDGLLSVPNMAMLFQAAAPDVVQDDVFGEEKRVWEILDTTLQGRANENLGSGEAAYKESKSRDFWAGMDIFTEYERQDFTGRSWDALRPVMLSLFFTRFSTELDTLKKAIDAGVMQWPKEPEPEVDWKDEEDSKDIAFATDADFDATVSEKTHAIAMFYAPWCGHCKKFKPDYAQAATALVGKDVKLVAVDATKERNVAQKFDIKGFPTILWFKNGQKAGEFDGQRSAFGVVSWLDEEDRFNGALTSLAASLRPPQWSDEAAAADVVHSDDNSFESDIKRKANALVMFYAPWCGHCTAFKPAFAAAATSLKDKDVSLVGVDATISTATAAKFDVKGYPTIKWFSGDNAPVEYDGGRQESDVVEWIESKLA